MNKEALKIKSRISNRFLDKVERQAKVVVDIISVKRERYVSYYMIGQSMIRPDKTRRLT
jgi:hypothetical protein